MFFNGNISRIKTIIWAGRAQCGLLNTNIYYFQTNVQKVPSCWNVALRQYIIFCWHFLTTDLSEILGTDCRVTWRDVTWRDITQEKRLYKHRCENLKFFIIHAILKCVTAHSVSCSNEANLQYGGWRPAVTEVGLIEIVLSAFWKMLQYASKWVMTAITVFFPHLIRHSSTNHATLNYLNSWQCRYIEPNTYVHTP